MASATACSFMPSEPEPTRTARASGCGSKAAIGTAQLGVGTAAAAAAEIERRCAPIDAVQVVYAWLYHELTYRIAGWHARMCMRKTELQEQANIVCRALGP